MDEVTPIKLNPVAAAVARAQGPSIQQLQQTINVQNATMEIIKRQRGEALDIIARLGVDVQILQGELQRVNELLKASQAEFQALKPKEKTDGSATGTAAAAPGTDAAAAGADAAAELPAEPAAAAE